MSHKHKSRHTLSLRNLPLRGGDRAYTSALSQAEEWQASLDSGHRR